MPQIQIKDALGNVQTATKVTNTGRTSHTDSMPVTLSNEDFAQLQSIGTKTPALVSGAVPVNPVVSKGAGVVDANTQRVTLASDGPTVSTLTQIDTKTVIRDRELAHYGIPVTPAETPADLPIGEQYARH